MAGTDPGSARFGSGIPGSGKALAANRLVPLAAAPLFLIQAIAAYLTVQKKPAGNTPRGLFASVRPTGAVRENGGPERPDPP